MLGYAGTFFIKCDTNGVTEWKGKVALSEIN